MRNTKRSFVQYLATGVALAAMLAAVAHAQEAADEAEGKASEIVVTGTLIRGIAPAGSNVVGIGEQEAKATGAVTTNQLLSNLPQSCLLYTSPSPRD